MRTSLLSFLLLPCLACTSSGDDTTTAATENASVTDAATGDTGTTPTTGEPEEEDLNDQDLGANASAACLAAAPKVAELAAAADAAAATAAYEGALRTYVQAVDAANDSTHDADITAWLADGSPTALAAVTARVHVAFARQYRDSLADVEEGAQDKYAAWDEANCVYEAAVRLLAEEADGATWHDVQETIAGDMSAALAAGHDGIQGVAPDTSIDDWRVLPQKQIAEKSLFRAAHRVIVELAGKKDEVSARRALELFGIVEDRLKDRNTPGIKIVTDMLSGDPAAIDANTILWELDIAFVKRTRRYCSAAIDDMETETPAGYEGAVEGNTYAKLILPGMLKKVPETNPMAYLGEFQGYAELVRDTTDEATLVGVSKRLVDQTCAYQTALGIAACTGETDETE